MHDHTGRLCSRFQKDEHGPTQFASNSRHGCGHYECSPLGRTNHAGDGGVGNLYEGNLYGHATGAWDRSGSCVCHNRLDRRQRKKRLAPELAGISLEAPKTEDLPPEHAALRRPKLLVVNMLLTVAAIVALLLGVLNNAAVFMVATSLALIINFRKPAEQLERIAAHAPNAMSMVSVLFAAGILNGVLTNTGMLNAMATALIAWLPDALGRHLAALVGILSVPLGVVTDPDSFYYAVLPMLAETGKVYGIPAVAFARAAMIGHSTVGWTISPLIGTTFLMVGLGEVELGDHQKHSILVLWGVSVIMLIAAILMGLIPL